LEKEEVHESEEAVLGVDDWFTHPQTREFWKRYFADRTSKVPLSSFYSALQQEFPHFQQNADIFEDVCSDLRTKISVDDQFVSLHALQVCTRDKGMNQLIADLIQEIIQKHQAQKSMMINDSIVTELMDVKAMLEKRRKELDDKEARLKRKEQEFQKEKVNAMKAMRGELEQQMKECEAKLNKEYQGFSRKLNAVERNCYNKLKVVHAKAK